MKILIIGDIHGRSFWREPVMQYIDEVDKVIFLGDELDPYPDEDEKPSFEDSLAVLEELIDLKKKYQDKVVLILGNHSMHYRNEYFGEIARSTRYNFKFADSATKLYNEDVNNFQIIKVLEMGGKRVIFSHAGISDFWLRESSVKLDDNFEDNINSMEFSKEGLNKLGMIGKYRTWFGYKTGSPLWCDLREMVDDGGIDDDNTIQIFGHTRLGKGTAFKIWDMYCVDSQTVYMMDDSLELVPIKEEGVEYKTEEIKALRKKHRKRR